MRDVQSSVLRMLHSYGIPADIVEEYDCVPVRIRRVGDTVKLQTMFGARAVKAVSERLANVQNAFTVTEYLAGQGVPRVPRFIRNRYGDPYVRDGNRFYYMTDWIGGRALEVRHKEHMARAVEELALWQRNTMGALGTGDSVRPAQGFQEKLQRLYDKSASFWKDVREKTERTEFERLFLGFAQDVLLRTQEAMDRLTALDFATHETQMCAMGWVCHGNFSAAHIRYDGEFYTIVDYDSVGPGAPLSDLVYFMNSHMNEHAWDAGLLKELVETYLREVSGADDWGVYIAAMLRAPLDILQLVEIYQSQDFKDEGLFSDVLEHSLELLETKSKGLEQLSQAESSVLAQNHDLSVNDEEVVHADLRTRQDDGAEVAAQVAKLETQRADAKVEANRQESRKQTRRRKPQREMTQIRVRKYRPKPTRRTSSSEDVADTSRPARLWGDAQHPGE
ncbi:phosphotransferase [Alicyclobacillus sp. SO9]|uniref:phosphotransferase n=1 Tax=Alicyclobacillus sp. SO9 TaxID=2665646 RepID=UPI0018E70128|nr:phosphotransferase [Alicyclobacillus sp. SO9]QQE77019.1 phosphotransferase [Alicyclobacillus sp. SO9]